MAECRAVAYVAECRMTMVDLRYCRPISVRRQTHVECRVNNTVENIRPHAMGDPLDFCGERWRICGNELFLQKINDLTNNLCASDFICLS